MKETEQKTAYYLVDESGDPNFYGKGGDELQRGREFLRQKQKSL
jgi:hypothetical protein